MVSRRVSRVRRVEEGCRRAGLGCPLQKKVPLERRGQGKTARARANTDQKREPQREPGLLLMSGVIVPSLLALT
jgi:hypothetical protein